MAFLLTWKNVLPVLLKSANALLQVPHRNFLPGSWGDSLSRGPKQANRSSETARNFLRSAFRLLGFFPQTEHLKTSFLPSLDTIIAIKTNIAAVAPFCFPRSRLYGSAATRLRMDNSILLSRGTNLWEDTATTRAIGMPGTAAMQTAIKGGGRGEFDRTP